MSISDTEKLRLYAEIHKHLLRAQNQFHSKKEWYTFCIDQLSSLPHFHWTGIYEYDTPKAMLTLFSHYIGLPTDHISIPKGKGVCGTAVAENSNIIVSDVTKLDNYLACSSGTRSEIVVLLKDDSRILGQIDVDSDAIGAFTDLDRKELEKIAEIIVKTVKIVSSLE